MNAKEILCNYWKHNSFIYPQEEIIESVLNNKDTFAVMPTGSGKSVCYQIPTLLKPGVTLVISPLIALMKDQVIALKSKNIIADFIANEINEQEILERIDNIKFGNTKLLYVSPERLQNQQFINQIKNVNFNLFAVDEAHCIAEWGHDFRPAYLKINTLRDAFPNVPILALTASATPSTQKEIVDKLNLKNAAFFKKSLRRKNLAYTVTNSYNIKQDLAYELNKNKGASIIFTRSRRETFELSNFLNENNFNANYYHAKLSTTEKNKKQKEFMLSDHQIMVATNAFGMGIDKPNIRTVLHSNLPNSLEAYFQEVGRAGRDNLLAKGIFLKQEDNITIAENTFKKNLPSKNEFIHIAKMLYNQFQIGEYEKFNDNAVFDLLKFVKKFKLNPKKTSLVLQFLDQKEVIKLHNFNKTSGIQLLVQPSQIDFDKNLPKKIIEYLARNYAGIFSSTQSISEFKLARDLNKSPKKIKKTLHFLAQESSIIYEDATLKKISFIIPRDSKLIENKCWKNFEKIQQNHWKKLQDLIYFINQNEVCREQLILRYFGEKSKEKCGICDVCLKNKPKNSTFNKEKILLFLNDSPKTIQEIITHFLHSPKEDVLTAVQILLDDNKIENNGLDAYQKK